MSKLLEQRGFCPRCAIKHLGKAQVLMDETRLGYPYHVWLALANMSEAEDEIVSLLPEEAATIRTARMGLEASLRGPGDALNVPNFKSLMFMVAEAAMLEEVQP